MKCQIEDCKEIAEVNFDCPHVFLDCLYERKVDLCKKHYNNLELTLKENKEKVKKYSEKFKKD